MDESRFDRIATTLGTASNRRTLAGLTAALVAVIGLETTSARKKKKKKKNKPPATCVPQALAVTCAGGKCGSVINNCKKQVDCGVCDSYVFDTQWGGDGGGAGKLRSPRGVAVDSSGNVYVADTFNFRIQKFSNSGAFLAQWDAPRSTELFTPYGVAVDQQGNVFATDHGNNRVVKFTSSGDFITEWDTGVDEDDKLEGVWAIAIDSSNDVYVSEFTRHRILMYSNAGTFMSELYAGTFVSPTGVAKNNTLYVVDSFANRVYRFPGSTFGRLGSGDGEFMGPSSVVLDPDGNILVTDTQNNRFQKFDRDGGFLSAVGVGGNGSGALDTPLGIALDTAGNVFVADFGNHLIQKFRPANSAWL